MGSHRYHIVFNAGSGTAHALGLTRQALEDAFAVHGVEAEVDADTETPLQARIERALASKADVIVAAGGDGTVTAIAAAMVGHTKTLAILPLGTANLLARDLGIPLAVERWFDDLTRMEPRTIDAAQVNGRIFLHKVVIGFMPGIAAGRERIRGKRGMGTKVAFVRYFFRRLVRTRRMAVELTTDDAHTEVRRVQALAVGNNIYDEGLGRFFSRPRLDRGHLSLYIVKHFTPLDVFRLTAEMLLGRWRHDPALEIRTAQTVTLRSHKHRHKVMFDGEVETLAVPMKFSILPGALTVLAPPVPESAPAPEELTLLSTGS